MARCEKSWQARIHRVTFCTCSHCQGTCDCPQPYCDCGALISFNNENPTDHQQCAACEASGDACERGDWMLWYLGKVDVNRRRLVLAACNCARLALPHIRAGEQRPRLAIETAERWARGDATVTLAEVRAAADAAYAYADAADAADAAYAYAAYAYAAAAADTADAAYAAADAYAAAARRQVLVQYARRVHEHFPHVSLPSEQPK